MSETTPSKQGSGGADTSKVTFFGQPAWLVIGGLAVLAILIVFIVRISGAGVPSDAVATVDGQAIPVADFNKMLKVQSAQTGGVAPDPPNYTKCIANKQKTAKKLSESALKKQCEKDWETAKTTIMTSLVQQKWYELEAESRGITVSDAQVKARFEQLKQQSFPKASDYQKFLKTYNQTEADLLKLVRASMLQEQIQQQVNEVPTPSTATVTKEYNKDKSKYATPASRDLNLVFNASEAKVNAAKQELANGATWKDVAKKYSQDSVSKQNGGKFPGVTKGQFPKELDKAVFSAQKGQIVGPIKTQYGYYVFTVTKTTAGKQQSLNQAATQIRNTIQQAALQKAQSEFQKDFTDRWRGKTKCAQDFKVPAVCGNTPKPKGQPGQVVGGAGGAQ